MSTHSEDYYRLLYYNRMPVNSLDWASVPRFSPFEESQYEIASFAGSTNSYRSQAFSTNGIASMTAPTSANHSHGLSAQDNTGPSPYGNIGRGIPGKVYDPRDKIVKPHERNAVDPSQRDFNATPGHREAALHFYDFNPCREAILDLMFAARSTEEPTFQAPAPSDPVSPMSIDPSVILSPLATPPEDAIPPLPQPRRPRARDYGVEYTLSEQEVNAPLLYLEQGHPLLIQDHWLATNPATRRRIAWELHCHELSLQDLPSIPAPPSVFPNAHHQAQGDVTESQRLVLELFEDETRVRIDWRGNTMNAIEAYQLNMGLKPMQEYWNDAHLDEGDYICIVCFTPNLGNEPACTQCNVAKVLSSPLPCSKHNPRLGDPGDWKCIRCKKTNWRKREYCYGCMPQYQHESARGDRRADHQRHRRGNRASLGPRFGSQPGPSTFFDSVNNQYPAEHSGGIPNFTTNSVGPYYTAVVEPNDHAAVAPRAPQVHQDANAIPTASSIPQPWVATGNSQAYEAGQNVTLPSTMTSEPQEFPFTSTWMSTVSASH